MVSDYTDAKTLLECFFRVDRQENTCKDKVGVGWGLSLAAWVSLPDTWHGLPLNSVRNWVENLCNKGHANSSLLYHGDFMDGSLHLWLWSMSWKNFSLGQLTERFNVVLSGSGLRYFKSESAARSIFHTVTLMTWWLYRPLSLSHGQCYAFANINIKLSWPKLCVEG